MSQPLDNAAKPLSRTIVLDATPGFLNARSLKRELLAEQRTGWQEGSPPSPEALLARWPTNPGADADVASILFEDFLHRRRQGDQPSIEEYEQRYPEHKESLAGLLSRDAVLRSIGGASGSSGTCLGLPDVGDEVFGFRLRHELGRGAFARVFLAEQADLAGRPVVVKVSGIEGTEPQTLAQLQHTHIVPIYSVHEDLRAGLRVVCMPYFGGASLSAVIKALAPGAQATVQGKQLVDALEDLQSAIPPIQKPQTQQPGLTVADSQTPLTLLRSYTYIQTSAWLVARLAEALQHAHQRGVLHRDIKPSNVLLAADGQPLLLDFNLAQTQDAEQAQASLGGTVAYMAPEHLRALLSRSQAQARQVDHRSDIYSLGMVLFELLTGQSPFDQSASYSVLPMMIEAMALERSQAAPSLRQRRPDVPWSLESIARKCLAPDPNQRYQQAEHLAEDLRRFLEDQPLRYAPELSRLERLRKWVRRHPRLTSSGSVAVVAVGLLLAGAVALVGVQSHLASAREELGAAQARDRRQAYADGTIRALCLVNTVNDLQDHLRRGREVCEQTLGLYDVLQREDWENHADWQRLDPEDRHRLAESTRELLLLLAWARVHTAPSDADVLRGALTLLDRAEAIASLEPSRALWTDRAYYLEQLGERDGAQAARDHAEQLRPTTAQDHYLLATTYARRGTRASYVRAVAELDRAVELNPRHYWSWVQRGICRQEQGEYTLAAGDFGTCIGLWPEFPWGYFNRGYALDQSGKKAEAIRDYSAALERDPEFVLAHLNRGLARLELKQYAAALDDFDRAICLGRDDAFVHAGRGMALEGLRRPTEADPAFADAFARAAKSPEAVRHRLFWVYGFAIVDRLPDKAKAAFETVLQEEPQQPQALYGLAMLAVRRDQLTEAIQLFSRALEAAPGFLDARRYRAILYARQHDFKHAGQDINSCLERDPRGGPTLYAAACVVSRAIETNADPQAVDQALDLLEKAFAQGHGMDKAADDPDLAAVRKHAAFQTLLQRSRKLKAAEWGR
jgi:serine/threonine protein kinase/Tfp pilus assembly protein PilF